MFKTHRGQPEVDGDKTKITPSNTKSATLRTAGRKKGRIVPRLRMRCWVIYAVSFRPFRFFSHLVRTIKSLV